jgi:Na+/H+ antiporter NhaD/arsenite permease-like protein
MENLIILIFVLGYIAIAFEQPLKINKAASALLTGVLCWTVFVLMNDKYEFVSTELSNHLSGIAEILFFLMGAMTIVELIDAHDGFEIISGRIGTTDKRKLLWFVSFIAFFLSAVLDNLTTAIVMVSLCRKLIADKNDRMLFCGMVVIAANAGGAWSPIGDVTTTMLWIGGQITSWNIILKLFLPSLVCLVVPLSVISLASPQTPLPQERGEQPTSSPDAAIGTGPALLPREKGVLKPSTSFERNLVFFLGLGVFIFVPVFKTLTHLPPYMGILFGLGILWVVVEFIHHEKDEADKDSLSVVSALRKIDVLNILFFLGILLSVAALQSAGVLTHLAQVMNERLGSQSAISICIGLISAVVDNVPLVAAAQGMYPLAVHSTDSYLWELIAYCTGTGGSILIIGSAAGVAVMGMEKINFFWYLKKIGWLAALGYFSGAVVYMLMNWVGVNPK